VPERLPDRIWNQRRQWLGNLIPLGLGIVFFIASYRLGFAWQSVIGVLVAWEGIDRWGFFDNDQIDKELRAKTQAEGELIGFVYEQSPTALDAHAEIGLLTIEPGLLTIVTEDTSYSILRSDVIEVKRRPNIHALLLLGGWISLELANGSSFRFESRKFRAMTWSRSRTRKLFGEIVDWKYEKAPA
jgi:hypothetical protein